MPLTAYACPGCQRVLKSSLGAGTIVTCPGCQKSFELRANAAPSPTRNMNGAASPPATRFRFDADDEAPHRREPQRQAALASGSPLNGRWRGMRALLIGGAMLLVALAFTAWVWPGYLVAPAVDANDPLRFLPSDSSLVFGADLTRLHANPDQRKEFEARVNRNEVLSDEQKRILLDTKTALIAGNIDDPSYQGVAVLLTEKPQDADNVRTAFHGGSWEPLYGQTVFRSKLIIGSVPDPHTIVLGKLPEDSMGRLLDSRRPTLRTDLIEPVHSVRHNMLWAVLSLDGRPREALARFESQSFPSRELLGDFLAVAKRAPVLTFAANLAEDSKSARVQLELLCDSSTDAKLAQASLQQWWGTMSQLITLVRGAGIVIPGLQWLTNPGIARDLTDTLAIHASGRNLNVSFSLSRQTLKSLEDTEAARMFYPKLP